MRTMPMLIVSLYKDCYRVGAPVRVPRQPACYIISRVWIPCACASLKRNCQRTGGRRLQDAQAALPSSAGALRQQGRALSATTAKAAADTVFTLISPRVFLTASGLTMYSVAPLVQSYTTAGEAGVYAIRAAPRWAGMCLWHGSSAALALVPGTDAL